MEIFYFLKDIKLHYENEKEQKVLLAYKYGEIHLSKR